MARKLACVLLVATLGFSSSVAALGLGAIDAETLLNEPLSARIPLLSVSPEEAALVKVELAPPTTFERAGVARLFSLTRLEFEIRTDGGQSYVHVTTDQPVKEPFLDFLVQVRWPQGRLVREYTVLLNPPVYGPETGGAGVAVAGSGGATGDADVAGAAAVAPAPVESFERTGADLGVAAAARTYGPVRADETLWGIVSRTRPGTPAEINQTMLAILRANPDAFIDGNINALKRGAVLRIPPRGAIASISAAEATAVVRRQIERWQAARGEAISADADGTGEGGLETAAAEAGPGEAGEVEGRLSVVAPENSAGDDATTPLTAEDLAPTEENIGRLQSEVLSLEERNASVESANEDLRAQVESLKQELADLQRAMNLRMEQALPTFGEGSGSIGPSEAPATGAETAAGEPAAGTESAEAENGEPDVADADVRPPIAEPVVAEDPQPAAAASTEPKLAAESEVAQPEPQPTFLETLLNNRATLAMAAGAGLLLLLLLLLVLRRRRSPDGSDDGLEAEMAATAVGGAAFTGTAGQASTAGDAAHEDSHPGADDALEEAEIYVAYGRLDQAQEVLDRALGEDPDNRALRVRLLEVLAKQGDRGGFEAEAQVLHTQLDDESDPLWQRTVVLGREIAPEHPLFSGDPGADADYRIDGATAEPAAAEPIADESDAASEWRPVQMDDGDDTDFSLTAEESARADVDDEDFAIGAEPGSEADDEALSDLQFELPDHAEPAAKAIPAYDQSGTDDAGDDFALDFSLDDEPAAEAVSPGAGDRDERHDDAEESDEFGALEFEIPAEDISPEPLPDRRLQSDNDLQLGDSGLDDFDGADGDEDADEVGTKLDLARAYLDMGDADGARGLLDEVIEEGSSDQKTEAQRLLRNVG